MANERTIARFYTDVMSGYDPRSVCWSNVAYGNLPPEVSQGYKRIWIEIEMPSDMELWPERLSGFELGQVRRRQIQVDSPSENRPAEVELARDEEYRPRPRRMSAEPDRDPRQPGN